jgi:site-specific DNA recombinase
MDQHYRSDLPYVGLVRVSRVGARKKNDRYITTRIQKKEIHEIAEGHGVKVAEILEDENKTGANLNRPAFQRARELVLSGQRGGIIVMKVDRLSRNMLDLLNTVQEIENAGGAIFSGDGDPSMRDATSAMMTAMRGNLSQGELGNMKDRIDKNMADAVSRGVHLGRPFGYARPKPGKPLVEDEIEAPIVQRIFELRADGMGWVPIARTLNETTSVRPRSGKPWNHNAVRGIVRNDAYLGVVRGGGRTYKGPLAHAPLVSRELWRRANRATGTRKDQVGSGAWEGGSTGARRGPKEGHLLTGLVRCAGCGYVMQHYRAGQGSRRYYRCPNRGNGACQAPANVNATQAETFVVERFKALYHDVEAVGFLTDEHVTAAQARFDQAEAGFVSMAAALQTLGSMTALEKRLFQQSQDEVRRELANAEADLQSARASVASTDLPVDALHENAFDTEPVDVQRHYLSLVFAALVVRRYRPDPVGLRHEHVADRAQVVGRDEAPDGSARLIDFCAALTWSEPAGAAVL